ncbi:NfeD family protein [Spirulina sp. CS-785/01]|uniref:NfeD family protein n=1 Tax=Spirulina sp. CS-785/01 TaxID=3021716 RepID=UPI00232E08DA|nr:NfeD family protein [Spirulina sp. CS-785/01]MDB9314959.1 NfeD family protein [Spirulina sp. CS-785/01]
MNQRFLIDEPKFFPVPLPGKVTVEITSDQDGRIAFQSSYYPAKLHYPQPATILKPGTPVQVVGRIGLTLLVK